MPQVKYKYNPETLNYEKVKKQRNDYFLIGLKYVAIVAIVGVSTVLIYNSYFESPDEKYLKREVDYLQNQLSQISNELDTLNLLAVDLRLQDDEVYRSIFGSSKYPDHLRNPGIGGVDRYKNLKGYSSSEQIIETKKRISKLERSLVAQSRSLEQLFDMARNKTEMLQSIPAIQPIDNKNLTHIASGFGNRIHPIYKILKMHTGMDFTASTGTEIYATGDGVVKQVEDKLTGYGKHVIIEHGFGYQTLYAHMSEMLARPGQKVSRGTVIGKVGNTGSSVGPHLHYEVWKNGSKVDPAHYFFNDLSPEQYSELLEKASLANQSFD